MVYEAHEWLIDSHEGDEENATKKNDEENEDSQETEWHMMTKLREARKTAASLGFHELSTKMHDFSCFCDLLKTC